MMLASGIRIFLFAALMVPAIRPSLADKPTTNAPPPDYLAVVRGYVDAIEKRYATEADRALQWFFENCQSAETGLLGWGR
jgi:hypothetical protein